MKLIKSTLIVAGLLGTAASLSACTTYDDTYYRPGYSSRVSVGVSSGPGYYRDRDGDGIPNRYDRDRDGDGVPNRYDSRPNNPYRP